MYAFSAVDGHQIWSTVLPNQPFAGSAVTARNGIVYASQEGVGATLFAVRESDGALLWNTDILNGGSSTPAVTSDAVYVSYPCPQTYKFDPSAGQQLWHYSGQCEGGGGVSAAVYQGLVYVRDIDGYPTNGITLNTASGTYVAGFNSKVIIP
jgi:outer membrane protein assembly factor BamB